MQRILSTCLLLLCWTTTWAGNIIKVSSTQGHPGDEVTVSVSLEGDEMPTAVEMQLALDDALKYVDGSAVLNAERSNGHSISAAVKNGDLSVVIFSPTLTPLQGATGELFNFKLKLGKEPADYTLAPVMLLGDAKGNSLTHSVESGVVTLLSPKLEIVTPTIDFGHIPIRSTYTKSVGVRNVGNEPLLISAVTTDRTDLVAPQQDYTIAPGNTAQVQLNYLPIVRGAITAKVNFATNAINPKAGTANVVADPFSVNELRVQRVEGFSDEEVTVVLKMNNMEPIAGAQCTFTLPDGLEYVAGSAVVGSRCDATDHVASGFVQGQKLTLLLYSSNNMTLPEGDGELLTFKVRLNGPSGYYKLTPDEVTLSNITMENMVSATFGEYVVIQSPKFYGNDALDFGITPVTQKAVATYSVSNNSGVELVINKATFLAEGYAVETELPLHVAGYSTKEIKVSYTPATEGEHKTTMQLYTNDPNNRMKSVSLYGMVYEPNHITLSGENTQTGYKVHFGLNNYTDIVAIQMNVNWKPEMNTSMAALSISGRLKGHSCLVTHLGDGVYQVLIYSMGNTAIPDKSGEIFTLDYTAEEGAEYRDTEIRVTDVVLSDVNGVNYVSGEEVKALATFNHFTLKFEVEGETVNEQFVKAGTEIFTPEVAEHTGYSFAWVDVPSTMPQENLTIKGEYTANYYRIIYMVDGEIFSSDSIAYGSAITAIEVPFKEGHTFSGWSEIPKTMPAEDVTISGTFTVNKYLLKFMMDDEVIVIDSVEYGAAIVVPDTPTKTGYTFVGWDMEIPESMPAENITITALWQINQYTVTFMATDDEVIVRDSVEYGATIVVPDTPTKTGYTFVGWDMEIPESMPAENITITALWQINQYTVTFMDDERVVLSEILDYMSKIEIPEAPTKEGYTFVGWTPAVDEYVPANNVTYYAEYEVNEYKLTYYINEIEVYSTYVTYGEKVEEYIPTVEEGYEFKGWITEIPEMMPAHDLEIYGVVEVVTPISQLLYDSKVIKKVYTLNGKLVTILTDQKQYKELSPGLYIVNGVKVLKK